MGVQKSARVNKLVCIKIRMQNSSSHQINQTIHSGSNSSQFQLSQSQQAVNEQELSPLLNNKINLLQKQVNGRKEVMNVNGREELIKEGEELMQEQVQFINSNSIVKRYQLLLITCLIISSIASVKYSTQGHYDHIKSIRDYFNCQLIGNCNRAIYQFGDNIGESDLQLQIYSDITDHFQSFVQVFNNFTYVDSFTNMQPITQNPVILSYTFLNQTTFKDQITLEELDWFFFNMDSRDFFLQLKEMEVNVNMGKNQRLNNLNITAWYDLSSRMLLNVQLDFYYTPNSSYSKIQEDNTIRIVQQLLAFFLLCSYLHNTYKIKIQNNRLVKLKIFNNETKTLQKNRAYWCYSLACLNIITMLTQTLAPLSSFLQLLPIFQRQDSANVYKYNFNTNLRYALPIVLRIFIPVVIMLNGFVFYSMVMYPGEYFEDYSMALFSYVYQNFQVGTYQIFVQLESRGNFAYALYAILYFYMVLVGSNLIPALFCTMIWIKIYQNDLKDYISKTVKTAICPKCNHCNIDDDQDQSHKLFELNISSPKISAYLKGKLSTVGKNHSDIQNAKKVTQMYVEPENVEHDDEKEFMRVKVDRIKVLTGKLNASVKASSSKSQVKLFGEKIDRLVEHVDESIFLTPLRSPLRR